MILHIEIEEKEIRRILAERVSETFGISIGPDELPIEVKSKQNYRSEWETAAIRIKTQVTR